MIEKRLNKFVMNGPKVWEFAVSTVPETIRSLLREHNLVPSDLDLLILHQSNLRMLEAIMTTLELPMEKTVTTVESYGNTAAASIPLTLQKAWETGRLKPGIARDAVRFRRRSVLGRRAVRPGSAVPSILITGAASGIGAGLAVELGAAGHHVIVSDLRLADCQMVAAQIRDGGGSADAGGAGRDLRRQRRGRPGDAPRPGRRADQRRRPADTWRRSRTFPMSKWDYLIQVMLIGSARLTRALLPGMRARGFGRIVNIGSIHSLVASPNKSAYVAAKHGLLGLTRTIALETAGIDITINTICPSYVKTPLVDKQIADQARTRGIPESEVIRGDHAQADAQGRVHRHR